MFSYKSEIKVSNFIYFCIKAYVYFAAVLLCTIVIVQKVELLKLALLT